jgi:hypothetical protein
LTVRAFWAKSWRIRRASYAPRKKARSIRPVTCFRPGVETHASITPKPTPTAIAAVDPNAKNLEKESVNSTVIETAVSSTKTISPG